MDLYRGGGSRTLGEAGGAHQIVTFLPAEGDTTSGPSLLARASRIRTATMNERHVTLASLGTHETSTMMDDPSEEMGHGRFTIREAHLVPTRTIPLVSLPLRTRLRHPPRTLHPLLFQHTPMLHQLDSTVLRNATTRIRAVTAPAIHKGRTTVDSE